LRLVREGSCGRGASNEIFFVDLPEERVRRDIFRIHLEKRGHAAAAFDLEALARAAEASAAPRSSRW
jgi:SpoVK/Ycf46/Vps4 family AAA+-type ATPase